MKHILWLGNCLFVLAFMNYALVRAEPLSNEHIAASRNKDVVLQERSAADWSRLFLAPAFQPPVGSHYVLLPRKGKFDSDNMRLSYQVGDATVTISQTFSVFAVQLDWTNSKNRQVGQMRSIPETQSLARQLFNGAENVELEVNQIREEDSLFEGGVRLRPDAKSLWLNGPNEGLRRANGLRWAREPERVNFFLVKDDGQSPSKILKGYGLLLNLGWFSHGKVPVPPPADNDRQYVLRKLIARREDPLLQTTELTPFQWTQRYLQDDYQAPKTISYVVIPQDIEPQEKLRASYQSSSEAKEIVTVTQMEALTIVQVDRPADPRLEYIIKLEDPAWRDKSKGILTLEEVQQLAEDIFKNAPGLVLRVDPKVEHPVTGEVVIANNTLLKQIKWLQDEGVVIFYWPSPADLQ